MEGKFSTEEQIRRRAYEIYTARGGQAGHEMDDWLQAEYELTQLPVQEIAELARKNRPKKNKSLMGVVQLAMTLGVGAANL